METLPGSRVVGMLLHFAAGACLWWIPLRHAPRLIAFESGPEGGSRGGRQRRLDRGYRLTGSSLAYSATKAAVISLTKNLARALAPQVRVNAVAPGAVDTSWTLKLTDEQRRSSIEGALLKRRCKPEDLAEIIIFLGFGAAMVTGQTLVVDGGLTLGQMPA